VSFWPCGDYLPSPPRSNSFLPGQAPVAGFGHEAHPPMTGTCQPAVAFGREAGVGEAALPLRLQLVGCGCGTPCCRWD
jgi:hypothetical protein